MMPQRTRRVWASVMASPRPGLGDLLAMLLVVVAAVEVDDPVRRLARHEAVLRDSARRLQEVGVGGFQLFHDVLVQSPGTPSAAFEWLQAGERPGTELRVALYNEPRTASIV